MKIKLISLAMAIILSGSAFADISFYSCVVVSKNDYYADINTGAVATSRGMITCDGKLIRPDPSGEPKELTWPHLNGNDECEIFFYKGSVDDSIIYFFAVSDSQTIQGDYSRYLFGLNDQPVLSMEKIN
jgi:hypothetical protein